MAGEEEGTLESRPELLTGSDNIPVEESSESTMRVEKEASDSGENPPSRSPRKLVASLRKLSRKRRPGTAEDESTDEEAKPKPKRRHSRRRSKREEDPNGRSHFFAKRSKSASRVTEATQSEVIHSPITPLDGLSSPRESNGLPPALSDGSLSQRGLRSSIRGIIGQRGRRQSSSKVLVEGAAASNPPGSLSLGHGEIVPVSPKKEDPDSIKQPAPLIRLRKTPSLGHVSDAGPLENGAGTAGRSTTMCTYDQTSSTL
jgi:hypothetical protein